MHNYKFINPAYVEPGQEAAAAAFDEILGGTLPVWADDMSEGYAWEAPVPAADSYQTEADKLAEHLAREYPDISPDICPNISIETVNAIAGAVEGLTADEVFAALGEELGSGPADPADIARVLYNEDCLDLAADDVAKALKAIPGVDNDDIAAALYSSKGADLNGPTIADALKDGCGLDAVEVANVLYSEDGCDLDAVEVADALYSSMYDEKKINGAGQHHQAVSDTLYALCSGDGLGMDIEVAVEALHGAGVAKADIRDAMTAEVEGGMEYSAAEVQKIMGAAFPGPRAPRPRDNGLEL